ncbi:HAL/PAL/TAL family ammonia-lyase [Sporosarcina limicola]|uniref:Histidine ammonia-lyase n=1 Tax=Sporosarcina limicola TaxID=34101 RepID=A0A927MH13_9BACL|nr:aromatic amino acid ammonia-lyase [Sporosarcina limicola]MBE1552997.1 histidine ammonia-lyase [Sporosarcina limicola]
MYKQSILLNGQQLSIEDVHKVAVLKVNVEICPQALSKVKEARKVILEMLDSDIPIYGFNRGVGANKDREIEPTFYEEYNRNLILSHSAGVGPEASEAVVRATMLARLNTLLLGCTGIQPEIVMMYKEFLNKEIHPVVPERGSVGVGDITCLSHIGLAMIGEGEVHYKAEKKTAAEALKKARLQPIKLGPKDGLAIVSSNALAAGKGALVLKEVTDILEMAEIIYSLSLEGLNGNVSPLDKGAYKVRPFPGQEVSASNVRKYLQNSYLWQSNQTKALQDPLCFRDACQVHGTVRDSLEYVSNYMNLQLNSSDDNPCLLFEEKRIIACSNYEVLTWVLGFEMLGNALNHLAKIACYRTIKLSTPSFTGLPRFLSPSKETIAFGTIQKTFTSLANEIRHLSNPSSSDYFSLAEDIEDHASNSMHVVTKTATIIDNLYYILGIEAMHAAQAIDLRRENNLGVGTATAYTLFRSKVPFLDKDRNLSIDINEAYKLLKSGELLEKVKLATNKG